MATTKLARMVLDGARNILGLSDGKGGTLPLGTANAVTKTVIGGKDVYKDKDGVVLNLVQSQVNPVTGGIEVFSGTTPILKSAVFSVVKLGVDITGVADATSRVLAGLVADGEVYIPAGAKVLLDGLVMPAGTKISGPGTILYKQTAVPADISISMGTGCLIDGVTFNPAVAEPISRLVVYAYGDYITIKNCKFLTTFYAPSYIAYETWIKVDVGSKYTTIQDNRAVAGKMFLLGNNLSYGKFTDNVLDSMNTGFQFYGGKYNTVACNKIYGRNSQYPADTGSSNQATITGINFLTFGFLGQSRGIVGNLITGNEVYGVAEEAIGLDTHGNNANDAAEVGVLPVATVNSIATSGNGNLVVTLQEATLRDSGSIANGWANYAYVIALNGGAVGFMAPVIASTASASVNTATITIPRNAGDVALASGDKLLITYGIIGNIISNNTVRNSTTGISLWGSCWYNDVIGNNVEAISTGIQVASVISVTIPGLNADGTMKSGVNGYSGCCKVAHNDVRLNYNNQPSTDTRGIAPITIGTWAYGTPAVAAQNPLMEVFGNSMMSVKNAIIGCSSATTNAGNSTVTGAFVKDNKIYGGGGIALNRTDKVFIGPNYAGMVREDWRVASSVSNTNTTTGA